MTDRELMQQALEGLEEWRWGNDPRGADVYIDALRDRLAQPEQEPVSMRLPKAGDKVICLEDDSLATVVSLTAGGSPDIVFSDGSRGTYLLREFAELFGYTTPPQRKPLTEEKIRNLWDGHTVPVFGKNGINPIVFARAIEAEHGIKENNT